MKMLPFAIPALALALGSTPAWGLQSAQAPAHETADRATMQHELADLRQRMNKLAKRMGKLSTQLALDTPDAKAYRFLADPDRGLLGVVIRADQSANGYKVIALTPDGPAQKAGIKVGDVITRVNGKPVDVNARAFSVWPLGDFKAGSEVKLGIVRDGKPRTVSLQASRGDTGDWPRVLAFSTLDNALPHALAAATSAARHAANTKVLSTTARYAGLPYNLRHSLAALGDAFTPWWGLNLAPLNSDLAAYFGTRDGALVLSTKPKRYPGLKAGDVITAVNGKSVQEPEDVMRALRGQLPGMTVQLTVRRHGKRQTVKMKVPSRATQSPPTPDLSSTH